MCSLLEEQIIGSTHSVLSVCLCVVTIKTKTTEYFWDGGRYCLLTSQSTLLSPPSVEVAVLMLQEGRVDSDSLAVHRQARLANQKEIPCLLQRHFWVWHRLECT